jgi:hypothetical protein
MTTANAGTVEGEAAMQPHRLDRVSLVFGLIFAALGIGFLVTPSGLLDLPWEWLVPVGIVGLGAALLVPALTRREPEHESLVSDSGFELDDPAHELDDRA